MKCLNPFGTGQCLTTKPETERKPSECLNPFGTGQCLTTDCLKYVFQFDVSQSLWNRAVSYDELRQLAIKANITKSQSLWNRAVSYDCSGVIKPCATRPAEATSQLFPRLRELGLDLAKF